MALATIIEGPTTTAVSNQIVAGGQNLPLKATFFNNINYTLTREDYYSGWIQFQTVFTLSVGINPAAGIGSADEAVLRRIYGSWAISSLDGGVTRSGKLEHLNQSIVITSAQYPLARNAAARLRRQGLASRPRFLASNSTITVIPIAGKVSAQDMQTTATGSVVPGGGVISTTGLNSTLSASTAEVRGNRRTLPFDVTDGILELMDIEADPNQYLGTPTNTLANIGEEVKLTIQVLPGVTGSMKKTVVKLGEPLGIEPGNGTLYVPGTLPAL